MTALLLASVAAFSCAVLFLAARIGPARFAWGAVRIAAVAAPFAQKSTVAGDLLVTSSAFLLGMLIGRAAVRPEPHWPAAGNGKFVLRYGSRESPLEVGFFILRLLPWTLDLLMRGHSESHVILEVFAYAVEVPADVDVEFGL